MWNNYFLQIQNKYIMRVSINKPLVIKLDGKEVTKSKEINLLDNSKNGFLKSLEMSAKYFTFKYKALAVLGSDEINFIFLSPMLLLEDLHEGKSKTNGIISLFSQYFFDYFNNIYEGQKIFWHGKCFSISENKINSYIRFRSGVIKTVLTTYFLKRNNIKNAGKIKLDEKIEMCKKNDGYEKLLKKIENGILYKNGEKIDMQEFLNGNIKVIEPEEKRIEDEYFDITKWDI